MENMDPNNGTIMANIGDITLDARAMNVLREIRIDNDDDYRAPEVKRGVQMGLDEMPSNQQALPPEVVYDRDEVGAASALLDLPGQPPVGPAQLARKMRNAFVTINNYTDAEVEALKTLPWKYICIGRHVGEKSKIPHVHALLEFKNQITFERIKRLVPRARIESRHGTAFQCKKYINKEKSILFESGTATQQGNHFREIIELVEAKTEVKEIIRTFPEEAMKYHTGLEYVMTRLTPEVIEIEDHPLRPWQEEIATLCDTKPHERQIYWVVDFMGGKGKNWLCRWLQIHKKSVKYLTNAKTADVAHAWQGERIVLFNFVRDTVDRINYAAIESIKDGMIFSPKYDSVTKIHNIPHVFCFSNFEPDRSKFSADRWHVVYI